MYDTPSFGKSVQGDERETNEYGLWAATLHEKPVRAETDGPAPVAVEDVEMERDVEFQASRGQEQQGERDYGEPVECEDRAFGQTLAAQERSEAREAELDRQREWAKDAHAAGVDRPRSCRVQTVEESRQRRVAIDERDRLERGLEPNQDPREALSREELAVVNQSASDLDETFPVGPSRAAYSRWLAEKVVGGADPLGAKLDVVDELAKGSDAVVRIADLEQWMADRQYPITADLEVVVDTLYQPSSTNQQQVGRIEDETGRAKLTIWARSEQDVRLNEGDRVRLWGLEIGWYRGQPSLAATSDTRITVLERGDGPSPIHGHLTNADFSNGEVGVQSFEVLRT